MNHQLMIESIREFLAWLTEGQRLFMTRKGYFGIATEAIFKHDLIFILPILQVPIVLCPISSLTMDGFQHYSVLRDRYLHGIMDVEVAGSSDKLQNVIMLQGAT